MRISRVQSTCKHPFSSCKPTLDLKRFPSHNLFNKQHGGAIVECKPCCKDIMDSIHPLTLCNNFFLLSPNLLNLGFHVAPLDWPMCQHLHLPHVNTYNYHMWTPTPTTCHDLHLPHVLSCSFHVSSSEDGTSLVWHATFPLPILPYQHLYYTNCHMALLFFHFAYWGKFSECNILVMQNLFETNQASMKISQQSICDSTIHSSIWELKIFYHFFIDDDPPRSIRSTRISQNKDIKKFEFQVMWDTHYIFPEKVKI